MALTTADARTTSRRQRRLVLAAVLALVGLMALLDLARPASNGQKRADLRSLVSEMRTDLAGCSADVRSVLAGYHLVNHGQPTQRATAAHIADVDEADCSPAGSESLYTLATVDIPASLADYRLGRAVRSVDAWAFPNAAQLLLDVRDMLRHPLARAARADALRRCAVMRRQVAAATGVLDDAARRLGMRPPSLGLSGCSADSFA